MFGATTRAYGSWSTADLWAVSHSARLSETRLPSVWPARKKIWYIAPLISSIFGSIVDTFLFFSISFYATGIPWITLALGDLSVKLFIALSMLIPFRLLLTSIRDFSEVKR